MTHPEKKDEFGMTKMEVVLTWFAFPSLTVEAGCVWRVCYVTDWGGFPVVAGSIVSASLHGATLMANAFRASFTVGVVNTT